MSEKMGNGDFNKSKDEWNPNDMVASSSVTELIRGNFSQDTIKYFGKDLKESYKHLKNNTLDKNRLLDFLRDKTIELLKTENIGKLSSPRFNDHTAMINSIAKIAKVNLDQDKGYVEDFRVDPASKGEDIRQAYHRIIFGELYKVQ